MALLFHTLTVNHIQQETAQSVRIQFEIPAELKSDFLYKEGQNITLKKDINGEDVRRNYSICSAPYENLLAVAVKQITNGLFSTYANKNLKVGDVLEVMPPIGTFQLRYNAVKNNYLAIAAGSGITPIISIIKHTLATYAESTFTLIYGNQQASTIMFLEDIEALKNKYMHRFQCIHVLSRQQTENPINEGRIDAAKLASLSKTIAYHSFSSAYLCGPADMVFTAKTFLEGVGISENHIHFELFTPATVATQNDNNTAQTVTDNTSEKSLVHIILDGRTTPLQVTAQGKSILDAALAAGLNLPFACKGGVCSTCKAKVMNGAVDMDMNYALEPDEVAAGYVLTCQSHPTTPEVTVNFDIK